MKTLQKYFFLYRLSLIHSLKNYKEILGLSIFLIACMIIFANLWKVVSARAGAPVFDPVQLLWYIAFNEWVLVSLPDVEDTIEKDLRSGRLAYLLLRPISYLGSTFAEAMGALTINLTILGAVTFAFTWLSTGGLPFSSFGFGISLLAGILSGTLGVIFLMLVGLTAFWMQEVGPFYWVFEKLLFMLGGLILPLAVYPLWLQALAKWTPFPAILGQRSALALDFSPNQIVTLFTDLTSWIILGIILLLFLFRKGLRILSIEGG